MTRPASPRSTPALADARHVREPRYTLDFVAMLTGVGTSTIRHYERIGLIDPTAPSTGSHRFSDLDVERVRQINRLRHDLGVNLAAVEVILHMRQRMVEMQDELARLRRLG